MKNQKGITLIELLVVIIIMSVLITVIWGVFIQGSKYSNSAMTKNQLIQEANIVITNMKNIHHDGDMYKIQEVNRCDLLITAGTEEYKFTHPNICYDIQNFTNSQETEVLNVPINPRSANNHSIRFGLSLSDKNEPKNNVVIQANLFRLEER